MLAALQNELQLHATPYTYARLVAWFSAATLTLILNRRQGISATRTIALAAACIPISVIGARALDAFEYAGVYPSFAEAMQRNGSSIYGGLALVFLTVWAVAAWWRIPPLRLLDAAAPGIALGESLSRVGCFLAGCCYGVPWDGPWAVTFPRGTFAFSDQLANGLIPPTAKHSLAVHPVQLYSAVLAFGIALWLCRAFRSRRFDGDVFYRLLVGYGSLRLVTAPLRAEALDSMKLFSVLFIVVGAIGLVGTVRRARARIGQPIATTGAP